MGEWKTIDTAPKDGNKIRCARFFKDGKKETHISRYDCGWIYSLFGKIHYCWEPTHWKEIPQTNRKEGI